MPQREHQNIQGDSSPDPSEVISSFDELAKGLATGAVSRRKALRWMGGALVGAAFASVPRVAWADDDRCPEGQTRCGERCVNLQTNERHCGSCSNRCRSTQTCCKGRCVNLQTNERHCGSCSNRCPEGQECMAGVCQCPGGGEFYEGYNPECKANEFFNTTTCKCEPTTCPEVICCCDCFRGVPLGCRTDFTTRDQCTNWCFGELGGEGAGFSCLPNEFNPNTQVLCGADNWCSSEVTC